MRITRVKNKNCEFMTQKFAKVGRTDNIEECESISWTHDWYVNDQDANARSSLPTMTSSMGMQLKSRRTKQLTHYGTVRIFVWRIIGCILRVASRQRDNVRRKTRRALCKFCTEWTTRQSTNFSFLIHVPWPKFYVEHDLLNKNYLN